MTKKLFYIAIIVLLIAIAILFYPKYFGGRFDLPSGQTEEITINTPEGERTIMQTNGTKHSIPLNEILSGGPPKDGIPAIDSPKFINTEEAGEFLTNEDIGLGFKHKGETRFYPFQILVWHELINDTVGGDPILITYCPLCFTGIVFERKVGGQEREFGVSGKLWRSNLLMYDRADSEKNESLWSQILGEAVVGPATGDKLKILTSDIVKYGEWKKANPNTKVLSRDTGARRAYGGDPYEDYYTSDSVGFGATFTDERLHPKDLVFGVEIDGKFKAYKVESLKVGTTADSFVGKDILIKRLETGEVRISADGEQLDIITGFWFSWVAVHPDTGLFQ